MSYFCDPYLHTSNFNIISVRNNMDNNSDDQLLNMQATIDNNR